MKRVAFVLKVLSALFLVSCGQDPGSFSMSFAWDKPPEGKVWFWVRVEERVDATQSGPILASAGPESYEDGESLTLAMGDVANGKNRYVIAEVRDGDNTILPIIYYGISDQFELAPGVHTHVDVSMVLQAPEVESVESSVALEFDGETLDQVGLNEIHDATIVTRSVHALSVVLANDAGFSANQTEVDLNTHDNIQCETEDDADGLTWDVCFYSGWDLAPEGESKDQEYTVFAKFVDQNGYESHVYRASVFLDSQGPQVLLGSLTPAVAFPGADVYLSISFHEEAMQGSLSVEVEPALPEDSVFGPPERVGTSNTYIWGINLAADWSAGVDTYTFLVSTEDGLGNKWPGQIVVDPDKEPLTLLIDPLAPKLVEGLGDGFSQSEFGLPDVGTELNFSFVIEEANPQEITAGAGDLCMGLCPIVKIGNAAPGSVLRATALDDSDLDRLGFRFEYTVDDEDFIKKDSEPAVSVSWTDRAGNALETIIPGDLHFDFQPPGVLSCSLVPEFGNATSVFTYTLTASEALQGAPVLQVDASTDGLFGNPPKMSDNGQTWEWQQAATGLSSQDLTLAAKLTDEVGNTSDGFLCSTSAAVDGEPPLLIEEDGLEPSLWTVPEVLNSQGQPTLVCGDGHVLHVSFTVAEAKGIAPAYPDVRLAVPGKEISMVQESVEETGANQWTFHYSVVLAFADHADAEGSWPVRVTLQDNSANETVIDKLADRFVKLDFTPPDAECSLIPAQPLAGYPIGQKVMVQIAALEELPTGFVPVLSEALEPEFAGPFFSFEEGTKHRFSRTILESDGEHTFEVGFGLTDLVGNTTPVGQTACNSNSLLTGMVDGAAPTISGVTVTIDDGAVELTTPLKTGRVVEVTVQAAGTTLAPSAELGSGKLALASPDPVNIGDDQLQWSLTRSLDGSEGEGIQYVRVTATDEAGNELTKVADDIPLTLDFSPPAAQCKLFPPAAKVGDTIAVTINTSEPLQGGIPGFVTEPEEFEFEPPEFVETATSFDYTHFVTEEDALQTAWTFEVTLTDVAGNTTDGPVCTGGGAIDAEPPAVDEALVSVWTAPEVLDADDDVVVAVGPGDALFVSFSVTESQAIPEGGIEVAVDIPGAPIYLGETLLEGGEEGLWTVQFELIFEPDDFEDPESVEGLWPLKAQVEDQAGNVTLVEGLGGELVRIDFTPPEAECSLIPTPGVVPYGIGQKILVQAAALEALSADAEFAPELVQQWEPGFAGPDGEFFVPEQKLRFAGTVSEGDDERTFSVGFRLTDLVGNQTPPDGTACLGGVLEGSIDGLRPTVAETVVLVEDGAVEYVTTPLRAGLQVTVSVTIANTAAKPTVLLGAGDMESLLDEPVDLGEDLSQWLFERTLDGSEGEGLQYVSVSGFDAAGNSYDVVVDETPLDLDFTAPTAECQVSPALAGLGNTVTLQVAFSEPLLGNGIPVVEADVPFTPPAAIQKPGVAQFTMVVGPDHADMIAWNYEVKLTDLAGNESDGPACSGSGQLDAVLPMLSNEVVTTSPQVLNQAGQIMRAVGDGGTILAGFRVAEAQAVGESFPQVFLNVPGNPLAFVELSALDNGDGTSDYQFALSVSAQDHITAEGKWPISVIVEDLAGNHLEQQKFASDARVQLDFTPPQAECSLVPGSLAGGYPMGQKVLLQVFPYEQLQANSTPILLETVTPAPAQPLFAYDEGSAYSFSGTIGADMGVADFTLRVSLTDIVGNTTPAQGNACVAGELSGSIDAIAPAISSQTLQTIPEVTNATEEVLLMAGTEDQIVAGFVVTESVGLSEDAISVSLNLTGSDVPFDEINVSAAGGGSYSVTATLMLDEVLHADAEGSWPVHVSVPDTAGNVTDIPLLANELVTVDFTAPTASCSLIPASDDGNRIAIGQKVLLQANPVEEVQGTPVLSELFIPNWNSEFFSFEDDSFYRWAHTVAEGSGERLFTVQVAMTDLVGNTTPPEETACAEGPVNGFFDGTRPEVEAIAIALDPPGDDPLSTPLKAGRKVVATIDVTNQALQPDVMLGTGEMSVVGDSVDLGDGVFRWAFQRTMDGSEGHGEQSISVTGQDLAGNTFSHEEQAQPLTLDFVAPAAQCSIFPAAAKLNDTIVFTVNVSETLAGNKPTFSGTLPFIDPEVAGNGTTFTYEYQVTNPGIGNTIWTHAIEICDEAGNCGTGAAGCTGTVTVDAEVPAIINPVSVVTDPVITNADGDTVKVVRDGGTITASFTVSEQTGLAGDSPQVWLNAGGAWLAMVQQSLNHDPDAGAYAAVYSMTANEGAHAAYEGLWPIRVELEDATGNISVTDNLGGAANRVRLDFTPPEAECSLIPTPGDDPYGIGRQVVLQVSPMEAVSISVPPTLVELFNPDPAGTFFSLQPETTYRWQGTIGEWLAEGTFGATVRLTDLVGNTTPQGEDVCSGEISAVGYDALRPTVGTVTVSPITVMRAGQTGLAEFTVTNTGNSPAVTVGNGAMSAADGYPQAQGNTQYLWQFERVLDGTEGQGQQQVTVAGTDEAGNTYSHTEQANVATFDFIDPIADCFINANPAKSGDTLRLTVSLSEPISEEQPDETTNIAGFWTYSDALSSPEGASPYYVFEHSVVSGDPSVTWETTVQAHDVAGNPDPSVNLCSLTGAVDASGIEVSAENITITYGGEDTGIYARYGSALAISFVVSDTPAQEPVVRVGGVGASKVSGPGDNLTYSYTFQVAADQGFDNGQNAPVTAWAVDGAGNETYATIGTVVMDFDAPTLATTPYFTRCDNLASARIDTDEIWVNNNFDAGCYYNSGCGQTGPVQVSFALSELIDTDSLDISVQDLALDIDSCNTTESFVTALYTPAGTESQQACVAVNAVVTDLAGNTASLELGCFWFDFTRPAQPAVNTANQIVYTRVPWGTNSTGGDRLFTLAAPEIEGNENPAVEADATMYVWDAEEIDDAGLIGTTTADGSGYFTEFELNPVDRSHVFITVQDAAGNQSDTNTDSQTIQATLVRDVVWYATLGDKVAGSFLDNPHTFQATPWFHGTPSDEEVMLVQHAASEYGEDAGITADDTSYITTEGALITWRRMGPNEGIPPQRGFQAIAFDKGRGRAVLFGGYSGTQSAMSDTWEWDGDLWHYVAPQDPEGDGNPEARWAHHMAFQAHRGTVLLFGGTNENTDKFNDTWEWNGVSWRELSPIVAPSGRSHGAIAYDSLNAEVVLFGGHDGSSLNDTWTFDGSNWTEETPAVLPPAYYGNGMAYDSKRNVAVMYGGTGGFVWEWNGNDWTATAGSAPGSRRYAMMAYHPGIEKTILVGGDGSGSPHCIGLRNDVWYWNGADWVAAPYVDLLGESTIPYVRAAQLVFDPVRGNVWLHGGQYCHEATQEKLVQAFSFEWWPGYLNGVALWSLIGADVHDGNPPSRMTADMIYSGQWRRGILFGGQTFSGYKDDTWRWYSPQWEDYSDETAKPSARSAHAMALGNRYFSFPSNPALNGNHDIMWLFGGITDLNVQSQDTWGAWAAPTGVNTIGWVEAEVNGSSVLKLRRDCGCYNWVCIMNGLPCTYDQPPVRGGHKMVYDEEREHFLMFGGYYTSGNNSYTRNDTWKLVELTPSTYEWGWTQMSSAANPSARLFHAMTYDVVEERVVLFGGTESWGSEATGLADTWQHNGSSWSLKSIADPHNDDSPEARWGAVMAYDEDRNVSVMFGGRGNVALNDAWEYGEDLYSWRHLPAADAEGDGNPVERFNASMTYDKHNDEILLMGGSTDTFSGLADTWVGRYAENKRPAHLAHFRFAAASYCDMPDVNNVQIQWSTGGRAFNSGNSAVSGSYLRVWSEGEWLHPSGISNSSNYNSPSTLTWSTGDAAMINRILIGDEKKASFVVFPRGTSHDANNYQTPPSEADGGPRGLAHIATDYVQYKVTYRLGADDHNQCE